MSTRSVHSLQCSDQQRKCLFVLPSYVAKSDQHTCTHTKNGWRALAINGLEVLAAVAAVVAAAACFLRLRAQLAATTREIDELRNKLAQQQASLAPLAPPVPVAQAR